MEITEKWLGSIGGWQVLNNARRIATSGAVSDVKQDENGVTGVVSEGPRRYQSGLRIRGRTDVENLCTCVISRGRGLICAHSIAVALATIKRPVVAPSRPAHGFRPVAMAAASATPPASTPPPAPPGRFTLFLPPNLLDGTFKGQAALFLRFEPGQGTAADGRLAAWLATQGLRPGTMPLMLTRKDLHQLFESIAEHPALFSGRPVPQPAEEDRWSLSPLPMRVPVVARERRVTELDFELEGDDLTLVLEQQGVLWARSQSTRSLFQLVTGDEQTQRLISDLLQQRTVERSVSWLVQHREGLDATCQLRLEGPTLSTLHITPLPVELVLALDGSLQVLEVKLEVRHREHRWQAMAGSSAEVGGLRFPLQDPEMPQRFYSRPLEKENAAVQRLLDAGFSIASATTLRLQGGDAVMRFYASELPRLLRVFTVDESQRWRTVTRGIQRITPQALAPKHHEATAQRQGQDWLSLDIAYTAPDGFRISRAEVLQMIRSGRRSLSGQNGKKYLIDEESVEEFEESLRDADSELTAHGINVRADKAQYLLGMTDENWAAQQQAQWLSEAELDQQVPDLANRLRPYQKEGVRYLESAMRGPRAALLADDMGLGKTVQTIAVLRLMQQTEPRLPALIVCPKSLIGNWLAELERFAPSLRVLAVQGVDRKKSLAELAAYDAVITTYQLVARDLAHYQKQTFQMIALDEASFIRNPDTEAAKALRALKSQTRIALTGTPIENSARDLWSIYHFLIPGYLGSRDTFKERFEKPLAAGAGHAEARKATERLRRLIRPFFLRRTKREVLKDLPEKMEQILWCDLSPAQTEIYKRILEEGHDEVRNARKRQGQGAARLTMFTLLLRLRQVCCDLRLTGLSPEALAAVPQDDLSGKLPLWRDRIQEVIAAGGKVLVFSQFVKFLHLLREELTAENVQHCYLDGQSNDRAEQVERFQKQPEIRVFLISLKAGGYGLNLTAADHVMLMDPWWNPAVEAQAIDRAHRIGQERVVTALRLVTRNTVEEKIIKLQAAKRGIIEATLDDASPLMQGLTDTDLEQVLS
jgi:superfamily II DNA or RNA helicase